MDLKDFYNSLDSDARIKYAAAAGTTTEYLRIHLIPSHGKPTRCPRKRLLLRLAEASEGKVSWESVAKHFFGSMEDDAHTSDASGDSREQAA